MFCKLFDLPELDFGGLENLDILLHESLEKDRILPE